MNKVVYNIQGEHGLVDTIVQLVKEGYDICYHATHKIGLNTYLIEYSGEVEKSIDKRKEDEANEVDWNKVDDFTRKVEIAEYAKEFGFDISTEQNMKLMIEEFKALSKLD